MARLLTGTFVLHSLNEQFMKKLTEQGCIHYCKYIELTQDFYFLRTEIQNPCKYVETQNIIESKVKVFSVI